MNRGYNSGDLNDYVSYKHLVMIPGKGRKALCFGDGKMYDSTPFTGGYTGSKMNVTILANVNTQLSTIFGTHLKSTWELLATANDSTKYNRYGTASGASTNWAWTQVKAVLMSEAEAYGSIAVSSSIFDTGSAMTQLPIFQQCPEALWDRDTQTSWWLKDVASGSGFAYASWPGHASADSAAYVIGVRPRFVLS